MGYNNFNCSEKIYYEECVNSRNKTSENGLNLNENQNIINNSIKTKRAWLCPHIHKLNYARGKCQNCYSNFYHRSKK